MFSLESDKMTVLWPNDSITFTFYETFSNGIPNGTTSEKEFVWFDASLKNWRDDCCMTLFKPYFQEAYQTEQLL